MEDILVIVGDVDKLSKRRRGFERKVHLEKTNLAEKCKDCSESSSVMPETLK